MATKTISVSEGAYNLLKSAKQENESFTDAIIRIANKDPLSKLVGILTKKEANAMREHIRKARQMTEERLARTRSRLS